MKKLFKRLSVLFTALLTLSLGVTHDVKEVKAAEVSDVLNNADLNYTSNSYKDFTIIAETGTTYQLQCAGSNSSIQLRSSNNNSGIVSTNSCGKAVKVVVEWQSSTTNGRTLNIYGSNTPYTNPTELYDASTSGTKLGTIVKGTSTEFTFSGDYTYVGFRSNSGAMYLTSIEIVWEVVGNSIAFNETDLSKQETKASLSFDYSLTYDNTAYSLVTNASDLNVDDKVIIVANTYDCAISTTQSSNNRPEASIVKNGDLINSVSSEVEIFTLKKGNTINEVETFAFYDEDANGYLYAASSSSNYLRTENQLSDNSSFNISIDSETGVATIVAQGSNTRNKMQYNNSSKLFACYSSAQKDVSIYKLKKIEGIEQNLVGQKYDDVKIKFGAEVSKDLFDSTPSGAGLIVSQREIQTGAADATLDEYMASNSNYKALSLGSAPTLTNNKYSVAGAIQVYEDDEFASATDTKLATVLYASVYFVVNDKVVILKSSQYSVKTMLEYYSQNAKSLGITGDTLTAVNAFNDFIA